MSYSSLDNWIRKMYRDYQVELIYLQFEMSIFLKSMISISTTVPATGNIKMKRVRTRLVAKLKRVCVHHAQVMLGTVERSKHDFY